MATVKKGDNVQVVAGKERGKRGRVLRVYPDRQRAIVEKLNVIKRHTRPSQENQQGGIIEKEGTIHLSSLMPVCKKCDAPARVRYQRQAENKKVRLCAKCGEPFDRV